jgi:PKD repeat protein
VAVTFTVEGTGGASFVGGASNITVMTNAAGRAVAAGLTPTANGALQISAAASFQGETAIATIAQTNVMTAAEAAAASGTAATGTTSAGTTSGGAGGSTGSGAGSAGGGGLSHTALAGIIGGAAAGGLVIAKVAGGGHPPTISTVTATPAAGILNATSTVSFSAQVGNPDNKSLTYTWDFGDGATGTGTTITHSYLTANTFTAKLTVSDGKDSVSNQTTVTIKTLNGTWRATSSMGSTVGTILWVINLSQAGSSVTGSGPATQGTNGAFPVSTLAGAVSGSSPRIVLTQVFVGAGTLNGVATTFQNGQFSLDPANGSADTLTGVWGNAGNPTAPISFTRQ